MQAIHPPLPAGESVLIGLGALVVVMIPLLWAPVDHFSTFTHEGAHALLAVILGLTVTRIIVDRHANGATIVLGEGLRFILVGFIGYLGPSLFGLGAARLISLDDPIAVLWVLVILLVIILFLLGRSFGMFSVPFALVLLYWILRYMHAGTEVVVAYSLTWLLLLSGTDRRRAWHQRLRRGHLARPHSPAASALVVAVDSRYDDCASLRRKAPHPRLTHSVYRH